MDGDGFSPVRREPKPLSSYSPTPTLRKDDETGSKGKIKEWNGKAKLGKVPYRIFSLNSITLLLSSIVILLGLLVGTFIYFGNEGYFKPVVNSTCINTCAEIPPCPSCNLSCGNNNYTLKLDKVTLNIDDLNITKYNQTCLTSCLGNSS
jgi:hypothetical protein